MFCATQVHSPSTDVMCCCVGHTEAVIAVSFSPDERYALLYAVYMLILVHAV